MSIRQYLYKCYNSSYSKAVNVLQNYTKHKGYEYDESSSPRTRYNYCRNLVGVNIGDYFKIYTILNEVKMIQSFMFPKECFKKMRLVNERTHYVTNKER